MKRISSRENPGFKSLRKLCQSGRERRKTGRIILDGMHLIESYTARFGMPEEIAVSQHGIAVPEIAGYLDTLSQTCPVSVFEDVLFAELSPVDAPSGILAIVRPPVVKRGLNQQDDAVLLDGVQDPGNIGSILRSAAAAGFRQVLLSSDCAHAWSPKVLRAGMGAHFHLDIHESCELPAFLGGYRGQAILTALDAVQSVYSQPLDKPVAWVFGSEGQGVRPEVAEGVEMKVRIPMPGEIESLNVAAAAAICLFETVRQRQLLLTQPRP